MYKINIALLIITVSCIVWYMYNRFIRTPTYHPVGQLKFPTPKFLSCAIPYVSRNPAKNKCENVKFDGWSLGHMIIYFALGLFVPGYWAQILVLSVLCEAFEYIVGWRARWLIDPIANMAGYILGHIAFIDLSGQKWMTSVYTTGACVVATSLLLVLNTPAMLPGGKTLI